VARICIIPRASNVGGVTSFQARLAAGLEKHGHQVDYRLRETPYQAVLLTGGVRDMAGLVRARHSGARIVQRLDGINWLHRRLPTGVRHYLRAEYGNRLLGLLRARFVTQVVYQSEFVQSWWRRAFGQERVPASVIHNGVDLSLFTPEGAQERPAGHFRLLMVEGSLQGGYENGLETGLELAERLAAGRPVELMVVGRVAAGVQAAMQARARIPIVWAGLASHALIPSLDRSAHLLFSADLNAACPNSVIEALACGLPVAAFATGALPELVTGDSGRLAPYGGDPWKLENPDVAGLAQAAAEILDDPGRFRAAARRRAEEAFGLDRMVECYLDVLIG